MWSLIFRNFKKASGGYVLILLIMVVPVIIWGTDWILKQSKLFERETYKMAAAANVAQAIADNIYPGRPWDKQKNYIYSVGAQQYNDACSCHLKFLSLIASTSKGIESKSVTKDLTSAAEFYKAVSSYGIGSDIARSSDPFPDVSSVCGVSWTKKSNAETNVNAVGFNRIGNKNTYSVTYTKNTNTSGSSNKRSSFTEDNGKFSLSMNTSSARVTCKFPELKKKATIDLQSCQADIIIAIPTNYAACTSGNSLNEALVLPSDGKSSSTPIVQISRAAQGFLERFDHTYGVGIGIIPYSGKLSLPPNRSDWTISLPMATQSPTDEYITQNMFYSSDGRYGGKLKTNRDGTSSFGTYSNWGSNSYGLPIMTRYGTTETRRGMTLYTGLDDDNLLSTKDPTSNDKYKFIRMNSNPCYLGFCNTLTMTCERDCPTYLANPYFIKELTADVTEVIGDLGLYAPIDDSHNKSNFLFLPIIWARNLFSSWTSHPSSTKTSLCTEKSRTSKKKIVVIIANAPDNFEPNEMTYLGFNNDFSEIPMYESDSILFAKNGYINNGNVYKSMKGAISYEIISGAPGLSSNKGLAYSGIGTAKITTPAKGVIKITATGSSKPDIAFTDADSNAYETQLDDDDFSDSSGLTGNNATNFYVFPPQIKEQDADGNYYITINIGRNTEIFSIEIINRPYKLIPPKLEMLASDGSTVVDVRVVGATQENVVFRTNLKTTFLFDAIAPNFWYSSKTDWKDDEGWAEIRCNTDKFSFTATGTTPAKGRGVTSVSQNSISHDRKLNWVTLPAYIKPYYKLELDGTSVFSSAVPFYKTWDYSSLDSGSKSSSTFYRVCFEPTRETTNVGEMKPEYDNYIGNIQNAKLKGSLRACNLAISRNNASFMCGYSGKGITLYHDTKVHIWTWGGGRFDNKRGCITFRGSKPCIGFDFWNDCVPNFGPGTLSVDIESWHDGGKGSPNGSIYIGGTKIHNWDGDDYDRKTHSKKVTRNSTIEVTETDERNGENGIHWVKYESSGEYFPLDLQCASDGETTYDKNIPYGADLKIEVSPRKVDTTHYTSNLSNSGSFDGYSSTISPADSVLINEGATLSENSNYTFKYTRGRVGSSYPAYGTSGSYNISYYSESTNYFYNSFYVQNVTLGGIPSDNGQGKAGNTNISSDQSKTSTTVTISPDNYTFVKQSDDTYLITVPCKNIYITNVRFRDFDTLELSNVLDMSPKIEILDTNNSPTDGIAVGSGGANVTFRTNVKATFQFDAIAPYFWYGTKTDWRDDEGTAEIRCNTDKYAFTATGTVPAKGRGITSVSQNSISHDRKLNWVTLPAYIKPYYKLELSNGRKAVAPIAGIYIATSSQSWSGEHNWTIDELNSNTASETTLVRNSYLAPSRQTTNVGSMTPKWDKYIGYTQNATLSGTIRACDLVVSRNNASFTCGYSGDGLTLYHYTKVHIWTWGGGHFDSEKGCITFRGNKPCIGFDFWNDCVPNFGPGTLSVNVESWHRDKKGSPNGSIYIGGVNIHNWDGNDYDRKTHSKEVSINSTVEVTETDTAKGFNGIHWVKYESKGEYTPPSLSEFADSWDVSYSRSIPYGADAIIKVTPKKIDTSHYTPSFSNSGSFGSYSSAMSPYNDVLINTGAALAENTNYTFKYTQGRIGSSYPNYGQTNSYTTSSYSAENDYYSHRFQVQHVTLGGIPSNNGKGQAGNTNISSGSSKSTTMVTVSPSEYSFAPQSDGTYLVKVHCKNVYITNVQFKTLGIACYEHPRILKVKPNPIDYVATTEKYNTDPITNVRIRDGYNNDSSGKTYGDMEYESADFTWKKVLRLHYDVKNNISESQFKYNDVPGDFFIQLWDHNFDLQKICWKLGAACQNSDYLDSEFGKFRSNYEFTGLHRAFIPYEVFGKNYTAFSGANNSALIFAGFTIPLNYFLYKNGYQSVSGSDGLASACTAPNDAISKLAVDACAKLKADGAFVYLVKYRMGKDKTSIDDKVDSIGEASNEAELKSILQEIAADIKERAGAAKAIVSVVDS